MKNVTNPNVSIIIPVYNEERYIRRCIESLIVQNYAIEDSEWIFIDGVSEDRTKEIIESYEDNYPITVLINKRRITPASLNMGIQASRGNYIIRMDAHAAYPSDYVSKCIEILEQTGADNVGGIIETAGNGFLGGAIAKVLSSRFGVGDSSFRTGGTNGYVDTVPFGAFRRDVFDTIGNFNEDLLRSEDNDINARIIASGGKVYLSQDIHSTYYCRDSVKGVLKQGIQNGNALFQTLKVNPKAMKIRHYIPFLFLLSLICFPIIAIWAVPIRYLFAAECACYSALDIWFSFVKPKAKYGFITLWLFPLFHISYGFGSALDLLGINFARARTAPNQYEGVK